MPRGLIHHLETLIYPGISDDAEEIPGLTSDLAKKILILDYKQDRPLLWITILGGTGTGKSTLFNALCGCPISQTGVERPKTQGPIAFAHHTASIDASFPLAEIRIDRHPLQPDKSGPTGGAEGLLTVVDHDRAEWSDRVLVDSPDLDSIDAANRKMSRDLYLLSDAVIFVTSQEKYADKIPSQLLKAVIDEKIPYFLLLNKVQNPGVKDDWIQTSRDLGISVQTDRIWSIDYESSHTWKAVAEQPGFREFASAFSDILSGSLQPDLRKIQMENRIQNLVETLDRLVQVLEKEDAAFRNRLRYLDRLYNETSQALIKTESARFTQQNRSHLRSQIRQLFARYDVLAGPRRMVKKILLLPLRFIGFQKDPDEKNRSEAVRKLQDRMDLSAIEATLEGFNRTVFENLSPPTKASPLHEELRQQGTVLPYEEIRNLTLEAHERLTAWLEDRFTTLSRGLPKSKRWGIYSASILWGILLLALETAIGGGFTILDALLDSTLAPFITKGAVELFAYQEIQKIVRELSNRYEEVLLAALRHQYGTYKECLLSLAVRKETLQQLSELRMLLTTDSTRVHGT